MTEITPAVRTRRRAGFILAVMAAVFLALVARAVHLQHYEREFLTSEGERRYVRVMEIPAHRGMITDRDGDPLAISTPVSTVWVHPGRVLEDRAGLVTVARMLSLNPDETFHRVVARKDKEFVYLRRRVDPEVGRRVMALGIPGVNLLREYRRYYPTGEVAAHVVGFTGIEDQGQEGLELAYESELKGIPGSKRVIQDLLGHVVDDVEQIEPPRTGHDLRLSLDRRVQFLAYRELKRALGHHRADSGSVVVMNPLNGEVLAMVNQPALNPNDLNQRPAQGVRNRAVTDLFEPGSTIKPFTVAAALEAGQINPDTVVDTTPGWFVVTGHTIRDLHNYGPLTVTRVLSKSSNVGATKVAHMVSRQALWEMLRDVGFGVATGTGFPGESAGFLPDPSGWRPLDHASAAFGYGFSSTALQLAEAYSVLAADGVYRPASLLPVPSIPEGRRVMSTRVARQIRTMLEQAVSDDGTAPRARVTGYRVAGKTGTVHKSIAGGYAEDRYVSLFAGMAPATRPVLVAVVVINDPTRNGHYGGIVAAPVFSRVMEGALRLMNISPDNYPSVHQAGGDSESGPA